jgi:hypothetical protein
MFSEFYGNAFVTAFSEVPNDSWIEELAQLSPQDVQRGVNASKRSGSDFAPSLPKFLKLCEPPIVEDVYRHERETQLLLEQRRSTPNASDDVKKQALAEMKNLLKFKPQGEMR